MATAARAGAAKRSLRRAGPAAGILVPALAEAEHPAAEASSATAGNANRTAGDIGRGPPPGEVPLLVFPGGARSNYEAAGSRPAIKRGHEDNFNAHQTMAAARAGEQQRCWGLP